MYDLRNCMIVRFEKLCSNLLIFQKKIQVVGKNAKLLSFRKKNNKNLFFQKRFFLEKKTAKISGFWPFFLLLLM